MSSERIEERLDAMLAPLRNCTAQLNEIAQARVQARLEAAFAKTADAAEPRTARGRWRGGVAAALGIAAAAVVAVVAAVKGGEPGAGQIRAAGALAPAGGSAGTVGGSAGTVARAGAIDGSTAGKPVGPVATGAVGTAPGPANTSGPAPGADRLASSAPSVAAHAAQATVPITVADGESAQLTLDGAVVTVYGPGRLSRTPEGAVVEAASIVVDRTRGDQPWSVHYHGVKVVAMHATFALDHSPKTRVTVMRGVIELHCPSGSRTIRSGASGTCEPAVMARGTPSPAPSASPEQPQAPDPPWRPEPIAADPYAAAESALRRGDLDAARDALLAIVDAMPDSLDAATALLDLARLAATHGDPSGALRYLDCLDRHPHRAVLAVAAAHLRATLPQSPITDLRPVP